MKHNLKIEDKKNRLYVISFVQQQTSNENIIILIIKKVRKSKTIVKKFG